MTPDKYSAVWVSHTTISDFTQCPRSYFLKHVYKDPKTGHKIKLMTPPLALGQAVHEVIDQLSILPTQERFKIIPMDRFEKVWKRLSGKSGGFSNPDQEFRYMQKGREMISTITKNPGPIASKAVKIKYKLPNYYLSEEENIILCGKVDWLEYLPETDSVHIIDFKTGASNESEESLQLQIYFLLVTNTQQRLVSKVSYWYLSRNEEPVEQKLPEGISAFDRVMSIAKKIKLARQLGNFKCETGGCRYCSDMERLLLGEGEFIGVDEYKSDVYVLPVVPNESSDESMIL